MTENETPTFDYWMIGILEECAKTEIKRLSSRFNPAYVERHLEGRNEYDNFGQIQLIRDRLGELRTHYDNEIKDGLGKTRLALKLLTALHTLIQETDTEVIEQAQANVQKRIQNAIKHDEPTEIWNSLTKLLKLFKLVRELAY